MIKQHIEHLLQVAIKQLQEALELPDAPILVQVDPTKDSQHGEYATNIALTLAKSMQKRPRDIAERIKQAIRPSTYIKQIEIAGPGFINFFLSDAALSEVVVQIWSEKENFGRCEIGRGKRILFEFLSSNPTGPLHVGHGRLAAFGDILSNLLDAVGFKLFREYYVNDAGRQMDILATSVWLRYLAKCGEAIVFPAKGYQGDYVTGIAEAVFVQHADHFYVPGHQVCDHLPLDGPAGGDEEAHIDALIARTKQLLADKFPPFFELALENILADIQEDLAEFGVHYDNWFSERHFVGTCAFDHVLKKLKDSGHVYQQEGALWFRSTDFGDEKDRVLVRSNGLCTYFAHDIAYHFNKFERGFDLVIDIFGSDHHGYTPRMKAAMQALGIDPERLMALLMQFVTLYRGGEQVQMSTRGGNFVSLRELRKEVGNDAARFFYVMRKAEQHMDFDLDLAISQTNDNPVYYVQYAYARICSVFKQLDERKISFELAVGLSHLHLLKGPQERHLLNTLAAYPDMIINAALNYAPHHLTGYLRDVANDFHAYYNADQFIVKQDDLRCARLALVGATRQVLLNGFNLLGITAPEMM